MMHFEHVVVIITPWSSDAKLSDTESFNEDHKEAISADSTANDNLFMYPCSVVNIPHHTERVNKDLKKAIIVDIIASVCSYTLVQLLMYSGSLMYSCTCICVLLLPFIFLVFDSFIFML